MLWSCNMIIMTVFWLWDWGNVFASSKMFFPISVFEDSMFASYMIYKQNHEIHYQVPNQIIIWLEPDSS